MGVETRDLTPSGTLREPPDWLWDAFGAAPSYTGKSVTQETALAVIPVYAAVRALAEDIGSLPLEVFRQLAHGLEKLPNGRLWSLLHDEANDEMAAGELWEVVVGHLKLWGNAFIYKERDRFGVVNALWPIKPSRIRVGRLNGARIFQMTQPDIVLGTDKGVPATIAAGTEFDFLHIREFGIDGLLGLSPIAMARQAIGSSMAAEEYQARFYANNGRPSGVLTTDQKLTPEATERLAARWQSAHSGLANAAKVAVLEDGLKWQTTALPPDDQQFIEQQNFGVAQIARLFRIPPSKINAEKSGSMTYSTVQQENLDYATSTLRPICCRIERAVMRDGDIMGTGFGSLLKFAMSELDRADTLTRYQGHQRSIDDGWKTPAEVREDEGLPFEPGLDYFVAPYAPKQGQAATDEILVQDDAGADDQPTQPAVPAMNGNTPIPALNGGAS